MEIVLGIAVLTIGFLIYKNHNLNNEYQELSILSAKALNLIKSQDNIISNHYEIDDQTIKLIKLASNNSSDAEARNAAIQACKRLAKKL